MVYVNLDENGYLSSHYTVDGATEPIPGVISLETLDGLDLTSCRYRAHRWDEKTQALVLDECRLAELEAEQEKEESTPTKYEQLRADVDFLAAMQGVIL